MNQKGSVTPVHYMYNLIFILFQAISLILQAWCMLSVVIFEDKSVHSHKSSCKHVYMMYVSSKHILSELPIGHRWLTWGDRLCLSSSWCSPRPSPADPLGRNICPVPAWRASLGVARCVEPPIPLAFSAQEGFSSNRSHRLFVSAVGRGEPGVLLVLYLLLPLWSSSRWGPPKEREGDGPGRQDPSLGLLLESNPILSCATIFFFDTYTATSDAVQSKTLCSH